MAPVKTWPEGERPRERLLRLGAQVLTDGELMAVLLGSGVRGRSAVDVGRELTARGWAHVASLSPEELCRQTGVGPARAAVLLAALEMGRRVRRSGVDRQAIRSSDDVVAWVGDEMAGLTQEQFRVMLLNTRHQVLGVEVAFVGGLSSVEVHPREVFRRAVRAGAAAVVAIHNHPSGDPTPSREDRLLTRRLTEAGAVLGIPLLDHVVIGRAGHVSFREAGWLRETV
ncbi:MAG: DNA repair protein RadC [Actinomycetia bacterium]|jgi:DNA repair protein RadC|nr:DNA repair protein RadC [Actinomycetes bacterium]